MLVSNNVRCLHRTRTPFTLFMRTKKSDSIKQIESNIKTFTQYTPRSENQYKYTSFLSSSNTSIVFGIGPAGCGKTMFACVKAIEGLRSGQYEKIILTRPIIPVEDEEIGFLPGSLVKKMDPWTRPIMDIFLEHYKKIEVEKMVHSGIIEISPLAYMRGRTFKRCFIIADEMQNSSPSQMLMLTTRIGQDSKMVITGDLKQSDRCLENGLLDIIEKVKTYQKHNNNKNVGIEIVEMDEGDIQRSKIVSTILEIFNKDSKKSVKIDTTFSNTTIVSSETMISTNKTIEPVEQPKKTQSIRRPKLPNFDTVTKNDAALIPLDSLPKVINTKSRDWFNL